MSLARAFTTKRASSKMSEKPAPYIGRAASQRLPNSKPIVRAQISLPVELISTTNMLSYEAPDIAGTVQIPNQIRNMSSSSSITSDSSSSGYDSDRSSTSGRSDHTAATSVDGDSPMSPEPNHLSDYFRKDSYSAPATPSAYRTSHSTTYSRPSMDSPCLPQRAPSHSMKAHVLSHKRSVQTMRANTQHKSQVSRGSVDMFNKDIDSMTQISAPAMHPFGKELEQLNEAAEEFGCAVRDAEAEADRAVMLKKGLAQFCANDYLSEFSGFYATAFEEDAAKYQPMVWI